MQIKSSPLSTGLQVTGQAGHCLQVQVRVQALSRASRLTARTLIELDVNVSLRNNLSPLRTVQA
jgi:hypothetical protein